MSKLSAHQELLDLHELDRSSQEDGEHRTPIWTGNHWFFMMKGDFARGATLPEARHAAAEWLRARKPAVQP